MSILSLGNGRDIYYELVDGEQEKPYLVFLHEGLGCTEMWRRFPHELCRATGCPGILYDRLGYGRSSPLIAPRTRDYLHEYARFELPEVISRLIPTRDRFLIGHSDGGSIALIHASEKHPRLLGIITEAAHVFVEKETLDGIRATVAAYETGKLRGLSRYHGEKADNVFRAWSDTWLSDPFSDWTIEHLLPSIECPVLALQGAEDQYATVAQVASIASKALDARGAIVERCGHTPHQEKPEVVLRLMKDFLDRGQF